MTLKARIRKLEAGRPAPGTTKLEKCWVYEPKWIRDQKGVTDPLAEEIERSFGLDPDEAQIATMMGLEDRSDEELGFFADHGYWPEVSGLQ